MCRLQTAIRTIKSSATKTFRHAPKMGITAIEIVAVQLRTKRTTTSRCLRHDPDAWHRPPRVGAPRVAAGDIKRSAVLHNHPCANPPPDAFLAAETTALPLSNDRLCAEQPHSLCSNNRQ